MGSNPIHGTGDWKCWSRTAEDQNDDRIRRDQNGSIPARDGSQTAQLLAIYNNVVEDISRGEEVDTVVGESQRAGCKEGPEAYEGVTWRNVKSFVYV